MSWIRKGNVYAVLAVGALLWAFGFFFMDGLLRRALIKAGEAAAGAKVEIASVKTKLTAGSLVVSGIAVANKNDPMRNLVELEQAVFNFRPGAALRGKVVIPDSGLRGLRFGTARKTSGALPFSKPGKLQQAVAEQLAPAKKTFDADFGKAKGVVAEVDPKKLASLKGLEEAQGKLQNVGEDLKKKTGIGDVEARIKEIQAQVQAIQGGGNAPADIARKAAAAADAQKKIKELMTQVDASRGSIKREFDGVQAQLKQADELRRKDVDGLLQAAGLPSLDAESLTRHLLGPTASAKVSTAVQWIAWARARSATQKEKEAVKPQRRRGVDFEFPRAHVYPEFLLEKADIDGRVEDLFQGKAMELKGLLTGVTSNPPLYGKPAALNLTGSVPGGGPTMSLIGTLDQRKSPSVSEVTLHYAGLPLTGLDIGDGQVGAAFQGGAARLDGTVRITGDQWKGQILLQADQVKLAPKVSLAGPAAGYASAALSGIGRFTMTIGIEGREDDLKFKITSDLGQALADGMKKAFSAEVEKQRKEIEAKVNALYAARAQELRGRAEAEQKKLLAPLDAQRAKLDEALKQAVSKSFGKGLGGLENLFKRR